MIGFCKRASRVLAFGVAAGLIGFSGSVAAAALTSGNVVVYRTGGSLNPATAAGSALATFGNPVFLDEYTPAGGYVQSLAMPIGVVGSNQPLFGGARSANNAQEGFLTRSANKFCLAVPGSSSNSANAPHVIARVSGAGTINTTTSDGVTSILKGVATADCNSFWTTSVSDGVRYVASLGAPTSSSISSTPGAMRALDVYGGQLFATTNSSPITGISAFGSLLPTTTATLTLLSGFTSPTTPVSQPYGFFFAKLDGSSAGFDTLYVADSNKGIVKFALSNGTWTQVGTPIFTTGDTYRGLTGTASGTTVTLFAVKGSSSDIAGAGGGVLVKVVDTTGYNSAFNFALPAALTTLTPIATAATNTTFRGVALAPESPQVTVSISGAANGTISPSGTVAADFGAGSEFSVTPGFGYVADMSDSSCGGILNGLTYKTDPVTANCTVIAKFVLPARTVTATASGNGTISPPSRSVQDGATTQFTVTPNAGHYATMGGSCPAGTLVSNTYTTGAITADCGVSATFSINQYNVTSSAGANGSIAPATTQTVNHGSQPTFAVTANTGYYATVGGSCGGSLVSNTATTYTLTADAVTAPCTVVANFAALPVVTSTAVGNGQISPLGSQTVSLNSTLQFVIMPDSGYSAVVSGCGGKMNASTNTFTTAPVTTNCTVTASFAQKNILFVGNSYTFARVDPAMTYNAANVNDLTAAFNAAYPNGANSWPLDGSTCTGAAVQDGCFEPHPWGGVPGIFKALTAQAGLDYNVSLSTRNAASLRGHFLNTANAVWDLRGNIASQKWDVVMVQGQSDEPLPANKSKNGNPVRFKTYANQIAKYVRQGNGQATDLVTNETAIYLAEGFGPCGGTVTSCGSTQTIPPNPNANLSAKVYVMQNWSRPDMVEAHKCTVADYTTTDGRPLVDPTCAPTTALPNGSNGNNGDNFVYYTAQPTTALNLNDITNDMNSSLSSLLAGGGHFSGVIPTGNAFQKAVDAGVVQNSNFYNSSGTYDESSLMSLVWIDRTHASKYGSYVSALVHFGRLTGQDPTQFGGSDPVAAGLGIITPADAITLQQMAKAAVVPGSPTAIVASAGDGQVAVSFTAPENLGGLDITGYTVTCGSQSASGASSPITVTGLTNGVAVSCSVVATNSVGSSVSSVASSSVTPKAPTVTSVVASANPTVVGQTVVFTASVTGSGTAATGTIGFFDGAVSVCASVTMSGGQATCTTDSLASGDRSITAAYSGDAQYLASTSTALTQTVNASSTLMLSVSKAGSGSGSVQSAPPGINCGADCEEPLFASIPFTLTATADAGSVFTGWSGACTGRLTCSLSMASSATVVATFAPSTTALNLDVDSSGDYKADSDAVIIVRYLMGIRGAALLVNTFAEGSDPAPVVQRLDNLLPLLDIDGDGQTDAMIDGTLMMRYLLGLRGTALIAAGLSANATRTQPLDIENHLLSILPATP
ncbi:MAG: Ig-like domain repeat protein [Betaproteobacteria bacterium]|nr:MAG: Ig-like domain repeat protein [Betaproteobacteria bacterium]